MKNSGIKIIKTNSTLYEIIGMISVGILDVEDDVVEDGEAAGEKVEEANEENSHELKCKVGCLSSTGRYNDSLSQDCKGEV